MPCSFQASSILAVLGDLVLALLGRREVVRVDILQPDEDPRDAGPFGLLYKVRNPVAERVDLDHQAERDAVTLLELDQPVEDRLPLSVAREIIVGDEESVDALRPIEAHQALHIVGRAETRLAPLNVDDGTERALIGAAAPGIKAGAKAERAGHILLGQERHGRAFDARQVLHEIVHGGDAVAGHIA